MSRPLGVNQALAPGNAIDRSGWFMYYSCMATKTITLEIDAYEKLKKAKRSPRESFSSVVRRAVFPAEPCTAADLLIIMNRRMREKSVALDEAALDRLDETQRQPRISQSEW